MSLDTDTKTGRRLNEGSAQTSANLSIRLLFPTPSHPGLQKTRFGPLLIPAARPDGRFEPAVGGRQNPRVWPGNWAQESWSISESHGSHRSKFTFVTFVTLGWVARWADVAHVAHRAEWMELRGGFCCVGRKFVDSVQDFGNEGTILDEGVVIERPWPANSEFHERE